MSIEQQYASQVREQIGLFATWLPNERIDIGQYGPVNGALFRPEKRLTGVHASPAPATATYDFTINADRAINTEAKALADAGVTSGNVLLEVHFQKEAAVTFSAPDAVVTRVDDLRALGEKLLALKSAGEWRRGDAIVVEVVTVPRATIIASQKSGAEVKFEVAAHTPVSAGVMATLNESNSLRISKGVGAKVIGEGPLTPLFRLAFLKSHLFKDPTLDYRLGAQPAPPRVELTAEDYLEVY